VTAHFSGEDKDFAIPAVYVQAHDLLHAGLAPVLERIAGIRKKFIYVPSEILKEPREYFARLGESSTALGNLTEVMENQPAHLMDLCKKAVIEEETLSLTPEIEAHCSNMIEAWKELGRLWEETWAMSPADELKVLHAVYLKLIDEVIVQTTGFVDAWGRTLEAPNDVASEAGIITLTLTFNYESQIQDFNKELEKANQSFLANEQSEEDSDYSTELLGAFWGGFSAPFRMITAILEKTFGGK
jgi:hypothetical protein